MVGGDPEDPASHRRLAAEAAEMFDEAQERLLGDILGVVLLADNAPRQGIDAILEQPNQLLEGREVAGPGALDECPVWVDQRSGRGRDGGWTHRPTG